MSIFKTIVAMWLAAVLAACGGGGGSSGSATGSTSSSTSSSSSSSSGNGTSSTNPSIQTTIFDNSANQDVTNISAFGSYSAKAVVKDANGNPVPSAVVTFSVSSALAVVTPNTALTGVDGVATVRIFPASGQSEGAAMVTAVSTVSAVSVTGTAGFHSAGGFASLSTITIQVKNGSNIVTGIGLTGSYQAQARVLDGTNSPIVSKVVTFSESSGLATFSPVTQLTDANGYATVNISPAAGSTAGASTITATTIISGTAISGSSNISSTGGVNSNGTIVAGVYSGSTLVTSIGSSGSYIARATLTDATGAPAVGKFVSFGLGSGLATLGSSSALTGSDGVASVPIVATPGATAGAVQLQVGATISSVAISAAYDFYSSGNLSSNGNIVVSINSGVNAVSVISVGGAYTASAQVTDSSGANAPGKLVTFSLSSNLASLATATAVTGSNGVAAVTIYPTPGAIAGGVSLTATTTVSSAPIASTINFTSNGGQNANGAIAVGIYTQNTLLSNAVVNIGNSGSYYVNARLTNAAGSPVANTVVNFNLTSGLATLGSGTALTNSNGIASVSISPTLGASSGALTVNANAILNGASIVSSYDFSSSGASSGSQVNVSIKNNNTNLPVSAIDTSSTYSVSAQLLDSSGNPISGRSVTFGVNSSLVTLGQTTALTGSNGIATVGIAPTVGSSIAGAAAVTASAVVNGVNVSGAMEFSTTRGSNASPAVVASVVGVGPTYQSYSSVTSSTGVWAQARLTDANGNAVAGKLVNFSVSTPLATLSPSTALTDSSGVARVGISAISGVTGAATLTVNSNVSGIPVSSTSDFAYTGDTVVLSSITPGSVTIASGGNTSLSLTASLSSGGALSAPANVTLTASCGSINGSNGSVGVATTGGGSLVATYSAVQPNGNPCIGSVQIGATSGTASAAPLTITVSSPIASLVTYVSATLNQIYVGGAGNPVTTTLTYKVLTASGSPSQNTLVDFAIQNNPGGVYLNVASATTDNNGLVTVAATAGTLPGPLKIRATIDSTASSPNPIYTDSQNLTVASGPPSQRFMSVSVSTFNIEGQNLDGTPTTITVRLADRQGNPVVNGTVVNFTAAGGQIPGSCATSIDSTGHSSCSVQWISQNYRPSNGRVPILAYAAGTKDYLDSDFSNSYSAGDTLYEMGDLYRDDNENGVWDAGEFKILLSSSSDPLCPGGNLVGEPYPSTGRCTGILSTMVRQQVVVMNSSSSPLLYNWGGVAGSTITFDMVSSDKNNLPMPAGTTVSTTVIRSSGSTCSLIAFPAAVPNLSPGVDPLAVIKTSHIISASGCAIGDQIGITVTSPTGKLATVFQRTL